MFWIEIVMLILGLMALVFNAIIIGLSFKKSFNKGVMRFTVFCSGLCVATALFSTYALYIHSAFGSNADITYFVLWLIYLTGALALGIAHIIRMVSKKHPLYT